MSPSTLLQNRYPSLSSSSSSSSTIIENVNLLSDSSETNIPTIIPQLSIETNPMEVGILLNEHHRHNTIFQYNIGNNRKGYINKNSSEVDTLVYPLLFPHGEKSWGYELKKF
jgi:hypothetical protein